MILLDSNILIYSCQTEFNYLKPLVLETKNYVSHISKLEVLGFPRLLEIEKQYFENVFKILNNLPINDAVIDKAIELRQQFNMKSNDGIIAATALLHDMDVYTRNVDDFKNITGLKVINPVDI
ncbi:MAG: PIN domain-containing protein [Methylococcaceae bacterium]|nr:PIN domain-containing protein [Methylococcaceae bacterium]